MSNLPLRRLADVLREIAERCDAVLPHDPPPLEGEAFDEWVRNWIVQNPLGILVEEAASLCERQGLEDAAKRLRRHGETLLIETLGTYHGAPQHDELLMVAVWSRSLQLDARSLLQSVEGDTASRAAAGTGELAEHVHTESSQQRLTLSESLEKIALELAVLPALADGDQADSTRSCVERLIALVDASCAPMKEGGEAFAGAGSLSDTIAICGRSYASAHHASLGEAQHFLDWLWFHLDSEGRQRTQRRFIEGDTDATRRVLNETGLDAWQVTEQWERAKAGILELLPSEWRQDFNPIRSRIVRERAELKQAAAERAARESAVGASSAAEPERTADRTTGNGIPVEHRTRVVTKAEAARLHAGHRVSNPTDYLDRQIKAGTLSPPVGSGKSWQFDIREFPESVRDKLR